MEKCKKHQLIYLEKITTPTEFMQPIASGSEYLGNVRIYQVVYIFCCPYCKEIVNVAGSKVYF